MVEVSMWLALTALSVMLLGTLLLKVFGRRVTALLETWTREPARGAGSTTHWGNGPA